MESSSTQEQEPAQQPQWRGGVAEDPETERRRRIIGKIKKSFPKQSMNSKAHMLSDLLSRFKPTADEHHGDCCEGHIKDRFHFVKKKEIKRRSADRFFSKKNLVHHAKVRDLVSQMNSPSFAIKPDPSEFDINRGVLTFSFFDKTPREPQVSTSEESSEESRPDVSKMFENCACSIDPHRSVSAIMDSHNQ